MSTEFFLLTEFFLFSLLTQILTDLKVIILFIFNIFILIELMNIKSFFLTISFLYNLLIWILKDLKIIISPISYIYRLIGLIKED